MNRIREIQDQIHSLYAAAGEPSVALPMSIQAIELTSFAQSYAAAARLVASGTPNLWLVNLQLAGQGVELALKACLAASGVETPQGHSLINLYCMVADRGFELSEAEQAFVVHLEHFYFRDVATKTKFKTRYPSRSTERLGGAVPDIATYISIIESLCQQADRAASVRDA